MSSLTVAAQFAAYTWYIHDRQTNRADCRAAMRFARANWPLFLPLAQRGLGRLLLKIARGRRAPRRRSTRARLTGSAGTATAAAGPAKPRDRRPWAYPFSTN